MHALHRPYIPRAMMITVVSAVLAIVLTLALATKLNDASTAVAGPPAAAHPSTSNHGWKASPLAPLLSSPAAAPWGPSRP